MDANNIIVEVMSLLFVEVICNIFKMILQIKMKTMITHIANKYAVIYS